MKIAIAIAATILSLSTLEAQATASAGVTAVEVQYTDLDLDRKAGIVTLYQRIQGAAKQVCSTQDGRRLSEQRAHAACVDNAIQTAVNRIDRPMLTKYVAQRLGQQAQSPVRVAGR